MAFSFYSSLKSIPARTARSCTLTAFRRWQAFLATGAAFRDHWPGMELDGFGRKRVVLPDGLRDVPRGQPRIPPSGAGLLSADGGHRLAITRQ